VPTTRSSPLGTVIGISNSQEPPPLLFDLSAGSESGQKRAPDLRPPNLFQILIETHHGRLPYRVRSCHGLETDRSMTGLDLDHLPEPGHGIGRIEAPIPKRE